MESQIIFCFEFILGCFGFILTEEKITYDNLSVGRHLILILRKQWRGLAIKLLVDKNQWKLRWAGLRSFVGAKGFETDAAFDPSLGLAWSSPTPI